MNISTLSTIAIPDHASTILSITLLTPRSTVSKSAFPIFPPNQLDRIDAESESNTQSLSPNFPIAHLPPELRTHIYVPYLRSLPCVLLTTSNLHLPLQPQLPLLQASPFFSSDIAERLLWRNVQLGFEEGDVLRTFLKEKQEAVAWVQRVRISVQKSAGVDCDWVVLILGGLRAVREVTFGFELWGAEEREEQDWGREWEERENWWEGVCDAVREGVAGRERKVRELVLRADMGMGGVREVVC